MNKFPFRSGASLASIMLCSLAAAQPPVEPAVLRIDASRVTAHVSPVHAGLMTEEINYSYDGGTYAELIRNRTFQDDAEKPAHWSLVQEKGGAGTLALDREQPLNTALPVSLKLDVTAAPAGARVGVANDGFWGVPVKPDTRYRVSFYAKASDNFSGTLTCSLESADGTTSFAQATVEKIGGTWQRRSAVLTTGKIAATAQGRFVISASGTGSVSLNLVSVFPPTWKNRPNGNRTDIMQLLADMKPKFLRFPGGNYLQGKTLATRFDWKKTIGNISERPGHLDDAWNYRSSDGTGLLEFLEWCEDLDMAPVLGVFAGFTLRGVPTPPGPELDVFVQEALEEIEYVSGDTSTKWGARRAKDGHPAPFKLEYVEIGNEDWFDRTGSYEGRFAQFFDAIKVKYPKIQVIASATVASRTPDVLDEHFYPRQAEIFESDSTHYDSYDRKGPKIFVGEWATRIGSPTPNLLAAIGDAAWMTGMERNSDLVIMHAYAPLFVNVSDLTPRTGSMQWATDLIGYNALSSYGSPAYYAQKMFSMYRGDVVIATTGENIPTRDWQPPTPRGRPAPTVAANAGGAAGATLAPSPSPMPAPTPPPLKKIDALYHVATRDSAGGTIYLKVVNTTATAQPARIQLDGVTAVEPSGSIVTLTSAHPEDTNSITDPAKVVPVTAVLTGVSKSFNRTFEPYSVNVLVLKTR